MFRVQLPKVSTGFLTGDLTIVQQGQESQELRYNPDYWYIPKSQTEGKHDVEL